MSTISASTTSTTAYKVTADTTGTLVLQTGASPTTAVTIDTSQNVAFAKGFTVGATAAPAFSAYSPSNQSVSGNTWTLVTASTEEFDTASAYNNTGSTVGGVPAYAFLPTIAGYYQVNVSGYLDGSAGTGAGYVGIYKNGSIFKRGGVQANFGSESLSALIYLNGTTDYLQFYAYVASGLINPIIAGTQYYTFFQASMVRSV